MKNVELTNEESQVLLQLLDAAVRHLGLQAANSAAVIAAKVQAAEEVEPEE